MAVGYQSFYQAELTANISETDTTIPLNVVPTVDEGFLVIESTVPSKREIIYFTSKTSNSVVVPSGAGNGRGYDGTTAVTHLQGAAVIMAPVGAMFSELRQQFTTTPQGWTNMAQNITGVTGNGNGSYDLTFDASVASILSDGMRLRTTRTVSAPIQCASLNGTNQYFVKTSPAGMTFTNNFVVSAWVKLSSYAASDMVIASRYNGTSGWQFKIDTSGRILCAGFNGGSANFSYVRSYQSVPLNKWVHIASQLDMSTFTATTTTSYVMIDGVDVPAEVIRGGTNPTALVQAGDLFIGARNSLSPEQYFPGKIAQVAIFNAKVTQATIRGYISQGLAGNETSLISAYSFNNSINDLNTTNANNLTAQNSAVSGFASAPYGDRGKSSTLDYALVMAVSGSTATVQVPEGCTIPTTGGVSAVAYSTQANPYGWVSDKGRWGIEVLYPTSPAATYTSTTWYNIQSAQIFVPVGAFSIGYDCPKVRAYATFPTATYIEANVQLSVTSANAGTTEEQWRWRSSVSMDVYGTAGNNTTINGPMQRTSNVKLAAATPYYLNYMMVTGGTSASTAAMNSPYILKALPEGL